MFQLILVGIFIAGMLGLSYANEVVSDEKPMVIVLKQGEIKMVCEVDRLVIKEGKLTKGGNKKVVIECDKLLKQR